MLPDRRPRRRRRSHLRAPPGCRHPGVRTSGRGQRRAADRCGAPRHRVGGRGRCRARVALGESRVAGGRLPRAHRRRARCGRMNAFPSSLSLLVAQTRYQLVTFWRIPVALFFTLGLPLIMLVLFNALFGDGTFSTSEGEMVGSAVLHRRPRGVHRGVGDVHEPGQHGADPPRRRRAQTLAGHAAADVDLPRRVRGLGRDHRPRRRDADADARRGGLRPRDRAGEDAGGGHDLPGRCRLVRRARHGARRSGQVGEFGLGGCQRDHPADGVRVEHLHPGRRCAGLDRGARQLLPAQAVRRVVPGLFHTLRRSARLRLGELGYVALWGVLGLAVALWRFTWEPSGSAPRGRRSRRAAVDATT